MTSARSNLRFPSLSPVASCSLHQQMGVRCTPMDCEFFRTAPVRFSDVVLTQNPEEEQAVERAKQMLSVPTKKKGKGKR